MNRPTFAFLAFTSGSFEGAIIRDMRLANSLHQRGYKVFVYWMMERNSELLDRGIIQRVLCRGLRYHFKKPSRITDTLGRFLAIFPPRRRREFLQRHPDYVDRLLLNLTRAICDGGSGDPGLVQRLRSFIQRDGITHLLPTFAMLCPFAQAAQSGHNSLFDYVVTFQGEEIFANYAEQLGRLPDYHYQLQQSVLKSRWPAIAVSKDYINRLSEEMSIDPNRLVSIYPGINIPQTTKPVDFSVLASKFPLLTLDRPIVTYIGRQDSEKGIDLLLYAIKILQQRGRPVQLVVCGGTSFGQRYRDVLKQISAHLRIEIHHRRRVSDEVRNALYGYSRCIVYPSIHREPFGMVAAEAMSHGTPVLVPDHGGITEVITMGDRAGGLTFRSWDSKDLADQIDRILTDDELYGRLKSDCRSIAEQFSVDNMTDQVLAHLGLPTHPTVA
jgi:glycosyltransferase involved in cell wall biosynthesis